MINKKTLIIVNCALLLILAVIVAVIFDSRSSDPVLDLISTESTSFLEDTQATGATEGISGSVKPSEEDTRSTDETTAPTEESTESTGEATKPTEEGTESTGEATKPTEEGTEPTGEATKPTEEGTEPTGEATKPTEEGTEPTGEATKPTEEGTEPTGEATKPTEEGTEPTGEATKPTEEEVESTEPIEEQPTQPEELPPEVTVPPQVDPDTGETYISFPCQVPDYDLVVEKLAPYAGLYVEDGSNTQAEAVAMLMIRNEGDLPVEYTQICVEYAQETLLFDITALPAGEKLVVQEKSGQEVPEGEPVSVTALVVRRAEMEMSQDKVRVTDNGDNTLTIQNLTDEMIPTVRVFYKYYMEQEGIFVGGIAFTVRVTRLNAGASVTIQPSHYTSSTTRVVMVQTYDLEV